MMPGMSRLRTMVGGLKAAVTRPIWAARRITRGQDALDAERFARALPVPAESASAEPVPNPLRAYFDAHLQGPGIWKWLHYFELYHRHLAKFIGTDAHLVEVGVFSGGSLPMWRQYLGPRGRVTGIDIAPECKSYEDESTRIYIGDQADRRFWTQFRAENPRVDVLIDDGGHAPDQQRITLEEMLPYLSAGGVYICEDIHGRANHFAAYTHALADQLNDAATVRQSGDTKIVQTSPLQAAVASITFYPYVTVIERNARTCTEFTSVRHGTEWQPFL
jgi:hypothetical protein